MTVTPLPVPGRVRLRPVPRCEPPYDDELDGSRPAPPRPSDRDDVQGALALAFTLPSGVPAVPEPPLRLVPDPGADDPLVAPRPTSTQDLPAARGWTARLAQAVAEVVSGERPVRQLVRWTSEGVYAEVSRRAVAAAAGGVAVRSRTTRPVVRSVHVCEPADGVAEACALVAHGERAHALALRLEGRDGRWVCTALRIG